MMRVLWGVYPREDIAFQGEMSAKESLIKATGGWLQTVKITRRQPLAIKSAIPKHGEPVSKNER